MKHSILIALSLSCLLSSCVPAIFGGAAASTFAVAKSRTIGETVDDVKISAAIKSAFLAKHFHELYKKIKVEVAGGKVLYVGSVEKEEDIIEAVKIAWEQNGVKEVISELTVDEKSNHFDLLKYTTDSFITAQIKARLFATRSVKFINYTIVTNKGVVYVFGLARSSDELEKVLSIVSKVKGVEKVVEHVKMVEVKKQSEKVQDEEEIENY